MARSIGTSFWQSASNEPNCGTTGIEQGGFLRGLGVRAWDFGSWSGTSFVRLFIYSNLRKQEMSHE